MNRQFIYGVGLALLGLCVAVVGDAAMNMVKAWMLDVNPDASYWPWHVSGRGIMAFAAFLVVLGLGMAVVPPVVKFMTEDRTLPPAEPSMEPEEDQSEAV